MKKEKKSEKENQYTTQVCKCTEERVQKKMDEKNSLTSLSSNEKDNLLHELMIQQIKLEMQNKELLNTQEELQAVRVTYDNLYDFAPIGYFTMSNKGIIEEVNLTCASMLGMDRKSIISTPFIKFIFKDDQDIFHIHLKELLKTKTKQSCELRLEKKKDDIFFAHLECTIAKDSEGRFPKIKSTVTDVSERKQAQEAILLNESRLESLVKLNQMIDISIQDIIYYALEESIRLTRSKLGFFAFLSQDEAFATTMTFPKNSMKECAISDESHKFVIQGGGIWGEAVRERRPIIINDYSLPHPHKKGYPSGHNKILRFMGVPLLDTNRIVILAGVANKEEEYNDMDVCQLTLMLDGVWKFIQRRRAEERIRSSLKEKEVLLREIHHRVKNNMEVIIDLLRLQSKHIKDKENLAIFEDSEARIYSMAIIHEKLYESKDFSHIDIKDYLCSLINDLYHMHNIDPIRINLDFKIGDVPLEFEQAINCGFLVYELVSNAFKHAFPNERQGKIKVTLGRDFGYNEIALTVSDDGIGIPESIDLKDPKTMGFQIITLLVEKQLNGFLSFNRIQGQGTQVMVKFRLAT